MLSFLSKKIKKQQTHFEALKSKWEQKHKSLQGILWEKHGDILKHFVDSSKQWTVGALSGLIMLSQSQGVIAAPIEAVQEKPLELNRETKFMLDLLSIVPQDVRVLDTGEEEKIGEILSKHLGTRVTAELNGKRLNRSYGYIGAEQHLARFPGDTMATHFDTEEDVAKYYSSGMAPGLGAWRYFAPSKDQMTEKDSLKEKYYIAVQTFLTPGYNSNVREYSEFFKFRKMLVVNAQNGRALVAVIGDAGPSPWTGKHLGGSPEVMKYLERVDGAQKGPVLYFFIDDPLDEVPLGPVTL